MNKYRNLDDEAANREWEEYPHVEIAPHLLGSLTPTPREGESTLEDHLYMEGRQLTDEQLARVNKEYARRNHSIQKKAALIGVVLLLGIPLYGLIRGSYSLTTKNKPSTDCGWSIVCRLIPSPEGTISPK